MSIRFRRTSGRLAGSRRARRELGPAPSGGQRCSRFAGPVLHPSRCATGSVHGLPGILAMAAALSMAGCNYSFTSGAGFPDHIRTIAVVPFENETNRFELTQEVHEALLRQIPRSLGLTQAGEQNADAVLTGTILRYELTAPLYRRGQEAETVQVLQREVILVVQVEVLDREAYTILWDQQQLRVVGQYLDASETEDVGRNEAIELLVQEIVDGAQSNW